MTRSRSRASRCARSWRTPDLATVGDPRHRELGLTDAEYELICERLERAPNAVELAMFSLLGSAHCAYKHSRKFLRRLPTEGGRVRMCPAEHGRAVDAGGGI